MVSCECGGSPLIPVTKIRLAEVEGSSDVMKPACTWKAGS